MHHSASVRSWKTPRRTGSVLVRHPAWVQARQAVLDRAAVPGTVLLVGLPGTGKSVMLRDLAAQWRDGGAAVTLVGQGDLPIEPTEAGILLIDETLRMPPDALRLLLAQRQGTVVLADVDRLATVATGSAAAVVQLQPLSDAEMNAFAVEWLAQIGGPGTTVEPGTLARVILHAGGTVRLAVQLLGAAVAFGAGSAEPRITGDDIDHAAAMRQNWQLVPDTVPPPQPVAVAPIALHPITRTRRMRWAATATALAACVALGWALRPAELPGTATGALDTPSLPPLQFAETDRPTLLVAQAPVSGMPVADASVASVPAAPISAAPTPTRTANAPLPSGALLARASLARPSPPPDPAISPSPVAALRVEVAVIAPASANLSSRPAVATAQDVPPHRVEAMRPVRRVGGPGMVLVAHRGDTLEGLYNDLYRDRVAPPYALVMAANPHPLQPGSIVLFPEPPGGWSAVQH